MLRLLKCQWATTITTNWQWCFITSNELHSADRGETTRQRVQIVNESWKVLKNLLTYSLLNAVSIALTTTGDVSATTDSWS